MCREHGADHTNSCSSVLPIPLPLHIPRLLILGHFFNFQTQWCKLSPVLLQGCFGSSVHLQHGWIFLGSAVAAPRVPGHRLVRARCPMHALRTPRPSSIFPDGEGKNSVLQSAGCCPGAAERRQPL